MVHICDCLPEDIPQVLAELPETLDETYERTLRGINNAKWEFAHRMFQFVSVASRPLHVKDLANLLAFNFKARSTPKLRKRRRLEDPVDVVLSICSTLLVIVNDKGSPVVQFSHFSVKEFLLSTRLAEATDIISRRYHISMTPAHTLAAQACLGILLHLNEDITCKSLEDFPLAIYAARHWVDHARFEDVSEKVEDGMKELFDPSKSHLAICIRIYDPSYSTWNQPTRNETPLQLPQTSLHYAAAWGLHPVVEFLVIEYSQDVCSGDSPDNMTPLHVASRNGHVKAACKLIEFGANLTAQDKDGNTPLHLVSKEGEVDVARMLIERGAVLTAQDNYGNTPLHLASDSPFWLRRPQISAEVSQMLLVHGADVNARNEDGFTPFALASEHGLTEIMDILAQHGADSRGSV